MVVTVQKPVLIPQVRFLGKVEDVLVVVSTTEVMVQTVKRIVWDPLSHSIKIDRRHPCRGAEAHTYRPDCSDGDRNSTFANLCASEVSLMECGHSGDFLLFVGVTEFSGGGQVA